MTGSAPMYRSAIAFLDRPLARDERGATTIEYALLASMLAIGAFAALMSFGGGLGSFYTGWVDAILAVAPASP